MNSTAMRRNELQRLADKAHHEGRIAWLSAESPRYADGARVERYMVAQMLSASREALTLINDHGMTIGHATCQRVMADGQLCGLPPGCPDCGPCLVDVPEGA